MINERERRLLREMERRASAEDPAFALRLTAPDPLPPADVDGWQRWRSAWRAGTRLPVLLLLVPLCLACLALNVSSLGLSFLLWVLVVAMRWVHARLSGRPSAQN